MRLLRVEHDGEAWFAQVQGSGRAELLSAAPWDGGKVTGRVISLAGCRILCPVTPTKIICVGRNYAAHAKELGNKVPEEPLLFLKPPSALCGDGDTIVLPAASTRVEHEAELGVVIGARLKDAAPGDVTKATYGYTCANDVTARDLQKRDVQFTRAKGFDTFCPVGPWIETGLDPGSVAMTCRVNGKVRQDGNTRDMVYPVDRLVAYISHIMTLEPGDLVLTGTPEGVGPLVAGDTVEVEVAGIGILRNRVRGGP